MRMALPVSEGDEQWGSWSGQLDNNYKVKFFVYIVSVGLRHTMRQINYTTMLDFENNMQYKYLYNKKTTV